MRTLVLASLLALAQCGTSDDSTPTDEALASDTGGSQGTGAAAGKGGGAGVDAGKGGASGRDASTTGGGGLGAGGAALGTGGTASGDGGPGYIPDGGWGADTSTPTSPYDPTVPANACDVKLTLGPNVIAKYTYHDVTLRIAAGGATSADVWVDGTGVPSMLRAGQVIVDTAGSAIVVRLMGLSSCAGVGTVSKAVLKYDRKFAWSHGFDDNQSFKQNGIGIFKSYGWRASVFLIGNMMSATRDENWIIDRPDVIALVKAGWGIGNHTWDHMLINGDVAGATANIRKLYTYLRAACDEAGRTDYKLIAFAAPAFDDNYLAVINTMRQNDDSEVELDECGNSTVLQVDPGFTGTAFPPAFDPNWNNKALWSGHIGRDANIECWGMATDPSCTWVGTDPKANLAALVAKCDATHHYWYNTLAHGVDDTSAATWEKEDLSNPKKGLFRMVKDIYATYGPGGDNSVWAAPSDEIYSYLMTSRAATVTVSGIYDASGKVGP